MYLELDNEIIYTYIKNVEVNYNTPNELFNHGILNIIMCGCQVNKNDFIDKDISKYIDKIIELKKEYNELNK